MMYVLCLVMWWCDLCVCWCGECVYVFVCDCIIVFVDFVVDEVVFLLCVGYCGCVVVYEWIEYVVVWWVVCEYYLFDDF